MKFQNEMVLASAGTGKTYRLTSRFLRLLCEGSDPDRILALTFTTKAAAEFSERILRRLADAAASDENAAQLAKDLKLESLSSNHVRKLLRSVIIKANRLQLGTIDSFFYRLISGFAPELGFPPALRVIDPSQTEAYRDEALYRIFSPGNQLGLQSEDFFEAFRRSHIGEEKKNITQHFEDSLDTFQELVRQFPDVRYWGHPDFRDTQDLKLPTEDGNKLGKLLFDYGQGQNASNVTDEHGKTLVITPKNGKAFSNQKVSDLGLLILDGHSIDTLHRDYPTFINNFLKGLEDYPSGQITVTLDRKKHDFNEAASDCLRRVFDEFRMAKLVELSKVSQGIFNLVHSFNQFYERDVREQGLISFNDMTYFLAEALYSYESAAAELAYDLSYRLDCTLDHWLLDEFQDTSRNQWKILKPFVDEVIQDGDRPRSFFYVGDIKQSIYGWRGGDHRLFMEIYNFYNQGREGLISEVKLAESYRSRPAIIDMVNDIFGNARALPEWVPEGVITEWQSQWINHSALWNDHPGWSSFQRHSPSEEGIWGRIVALLNEIQPWEKGMSTAILCRSGKNVSECLQYLRKHLPKVSIFSPTEVSPGKDSPIILAGLNFFKCLCNPDDTLARIIVKSSPLSHCLDKLSQSSLPQVAAQGLESLWNMLSREIDWSLEKPFALRRWRQMEILARRMDAEPDSSIESFLRAAEATRENEESSGAGIQILTTHKSKGLDYDWVIVPVGISNTLVRADKNLLVKTVPEESNEEPFVMVRPRKELIEMDAILSEVNATDEENAYFESLCVLYVALTRARYGLTLICEMEKEGKAKDDYNIIKSALNLPDMEEEEDPVIYEKGSWADFNTLDLSKTKAEIPGSISSIPVVEHSAPPALKRRLPSRDEVAALSGRELFQLGSRGATQLGDLVHHSLEKIEWVDPGASLEEFLNMCEVEDEAAIELLTHAWTHSSLKSVIARPEGIAPVVWREAPFEWVRGEEWISGIIDRVHLFQHPDGSYERAEVYDYKTNRDWNPETLKKHYQGQMDLYREAVRHLTGLPEEKIKVQLVALRAE